MMLAQGRQSQSPRGADDARMGLSPSSPDSGCFHGASAGGSGKAGKLSMSPISAVLATEILHTQEEMQAEEYVRFGHSIKLLATSQYLKNEKQVPMAGAKLGGYVGMYAKTDGTTRLAVPPIGDSAEGEFRESVLTVRDPYGQAEDGTVVLYGNVVVLVDENGFVWNNKCGTGTFSAFFEGYLGPKPRGSPGEVYVSFTKNGHEGRPLVYGENAVYIDVEASHRTRSSFNYRLTNFKSANSRIQGGYICSDSTGFPLAFSVHRHSGPPIQAYERPEPKIPTLPKKKADLGSVYLPPQIKYVAVKRASEKGDEEMLDMMIKDPHFGEPVKLYMVSPDDTIIIELDQENGYATLPARHLFNTAESAAASSSNAAHSPSIQIDIALGKKKPETPTDGAPLNQPTSPRGTKSKKISNQTAELGSVELVVEQDLAVLRRAFQGDGISFTDEDYMGGADSSSRFSKLGKLDLLIACHKLAMSYFLFAVVIPYFIWQCVLVIGDLIEPIHQLAQANKSLALIERLATTLVEDFGIEVENGKAVIDDTHRSMETTTLTSSVISFLISFALGLITPEFAIAGVGKDRSNAKSSSKGLTRQNSSFSLNNDSEKANWLVYIHGAWDSSNIGIFSQRTINGLEDDEDELDTDEQDESSEDMKGSSDETEKYKVNGVVVKGLWGNAGVDENGVPKHPAFKRFLNGEKGDMAAAKSRWIRTCDWRAEGKIDEILKQPHPFFRIIRENVPNYYYGRGKLGYPVYIDCPGGVKLKNLRKAGVKLSDLLFHFTFSTEYLWSMLEPSEEGRTISILDLEGIGMWDFVGEVTDFVKKTIALSNEHYPERAYRIYIVNAPRFFTGIWAVVKPMLDEATRKKIQIHRNNYAASLLEEIDADVLPVKYGGKNETPLGRSDEDRLLESHVYRVLIEKGVPLVDEAGKPIPGTPENLKDQIDDTLVGGESKLKMDLIQAAMAPSSSGKASPK